MRAIKFMNEVVSQLLPYVALDRLGPRLVGEVLPGFDYFVVDKSLQPRLIAMQSSDLVSECRAVHVHFL